MQADRSRISQLLGIDRLLHQPGDVDRSWTRLPIRRSQHVLNDLRNPLRLGLDLLEAVPDPIGHLWIRQRSRYDCEYRGDRLAQVMSGLLDHSRSATAILRAFRGSRFSVHGSLPR